jgi:hypothetical protein
VNLNRLRCKFILVCCCNELGVLDRKGTQRSTLASTVTQSSSPPLHPSSELEAGFQPTRDRVCEYTFEVRWKVDLIYFSTDASLPNQPHIPIRVLDTDPNTDDRGDEDHDAAK